MEVFYDAETRNKIKQAAKNHGHPEVGDAISAYLTALNKKPYEFKKLFGKLRQNMTPEEFAARVNAIEGNVSYQLAQKFKPVYHAAIRALKQAAAEQDRAEANIDKLEGKLSAAEKEISAKETARKSAVAHMTMTNDLLDAANANYAAAEARYVATQAELEEERAKNSFDPRKLAKLIRDEPLKVQKIEDKRLDQLL